MGVHTASISPPIIEQELKFLGAGMAGDEYGYTVVRITPFLMMNLARVRTMTKVF